MIFALHQVNGVVHEEQRRYLARLRIHIRVRHFYAIPKGHDIRKEGQTNSVRTSLKPSVKQETRQVADAFMPLQHVV
jgi:hypothetical protein